MHRRTTTHVRRHALRPPRAQRGAPSLRVHPRAGAPRRVRRRRPCAKLPHTLRAYRRTRRLGPGAPRACFRHTRRARRRSEPRCVCRTTRAPTSPSCLAQRRPMCSACGCLSAFCSQLVRRSVPCTVHTRRSSAASSRPRAKRRVPPTSRRSPHFFRCKRVVPARCAKRQRAPVHSKTWLCGRVRAQARGHGLWRPRRPQRQCRRCRRRPPRTSLASCVPRRSVRPSTPRRPRDHLRRPLLRPTRPTRVSSLWACAPPTSPARHRSRVSSRRVRCSCAYVDLVISPNVH